MKYKAFAKPAVAIVAILVAAACATNADDVPAGEADPGTQTQSEGGAQLPPTENKPPENKPPEKKCASSCTADTDCASTCADPGTGAVNCCDLATKQCYKAAAAVCPAPSSDPDGGAPAY